ncbi:MAG: sulfotransferase [Myxococcota bacterium]
MVADAKLQTPPHFIIVGAQKSGTSTLHGILDGHPDVFIPDREIFFFDIDDPEQHPDFRPADGSTRDFDRDFDEYAAWYARFYVRARHGQLRGEDSTSYLPSTLAPARIAALCPDVKVIALLRDPVARAYSHYWHDVSRGRCSDTFSDVVRDESSLVIRRGLYAEQIQRYHDALGRERVHVIVFEEFCRNLERVSAEACAFLGLPPPPLAALERERYNVARVPGNLELRLWANRSLPWLMQKSYRGLLPEPSQAQGLLSGPWRERLWNSPAAKHGNRLLDALRPKRRYPPIPEAARARLRTLYGQANAGLAELVRRDDLDQWWPSLRDA